MFGNTKETIEKLTEHLLRLETRIVVLENAAQCAVGNHVWQLRTRYSRRTEMERNLQMLGLSGNGSTEIYIGCQHCFIAKDKAIPELNNETSA